MLFCPALPQNNSRKHLENNLEIQGLASYFTFYLCTARYPGFTQTSGNLLLHIVLEKVTLQPNYYWLFKFLSITNACESIGPVKKSLWPNKHIFFWLWKCSDPLVVISSSPGLVILVYVKTVCPITMRKKNSEDIWMFWLLGPPGWGFFLVTCATLIENGVPWTLVEEITKIAIYDLSYMTPWD